MRGWRVGTAVSVMLAMAMCQGVSVTAKTRVVHYHWGAWGPAVQILLKKEAADFMKVNPDIQVDIVPNQGFDKLLVMMASGKPPDVFDCYIGGVAVYVKANLLTDLTPFMKRDKLNPADYVRPVYDAFTNGGKLYGYPIGYGSVGTIYNKRLMSQAGLATPNSLQETGGWDWAAFLSYAKKLTKDTNSDGKPDQWGVAAAADIGRYPMWAHQAGQMLFDKSLQPGKSFFSKPGAVEGLRFYSDLFLRDKVTNTGLMWTAIEAGKTAMDVGAFAGNHTTIYSAVGDKIPIDVVEVPRGPKNAGSLFSANAYHIPRGSKNKEATWKWIKYLLLSKGSPEKWMAASGKPFARKGYDAEYVRSPHFPEHVDAYIKMANDPDSLPIYDSSLQDFNALGNQLISRLLSGKISLAQFPADADKQYDQLFKRLKQK